MNIKFVGHEGDDSVFEMDEEDKKPVVKGKTETTVTEEDIDVVDDTPDEDKNKSPMPKHIVDELEADDLESYDKAAKVKLKQLKKVWHDERREKERADRERAAASDAAVRLNEENKRLRAMITQGTKEYAETYKSAADAELDSARKAYTEAYDSGDAKAVLVAQEKLFEAQNKINLAKNFKGPLQDEKFEVKATEEVQKPSLDPSTKAWQDKNTWYGSDPEMTATAFGRHQKLILERGEAFVGTPEYWQDIDKTMRKRHAEYFGDDKSTDKGQKTQRAKPATVVAPASRSTSPKRITLKQSQVDYAKKHNIPIEVYAKEYMKLYGDDK